MSTIEGGEPAPPGQLYAGAEVLTMEPEQPQAQAVAVREGHIVAVGSEDECRNALAAGGGDFGRIDLGGGCLLPGFIDTHLHPIAMIYFEQNADLGSVRSIGELKEVIREAAAATRGEGWVVGLQLDDEALTERRLPTRHELDDACDELPVVVMKRDGHTVVGNTRALRAAGMTAATADPEGGRIDREPGGEPAGPCRENATQMLLSAMPAPDLEAFRDSAHRCFRRMAGHGITSAGVVLQTDDEGPGGNMASIETLAMELLLPDVPFSLYGILMGRTLDGVLAARRGALNAPGSGHRVGAYKMFADGTFGACTACMSAPFADRPDRSGFMTLPEHEMLARMARAQEHDLQICVHAIGDEANRRCIDLFGRLLADHPHRDHRHRLEHASLLTPDLVERIAELGLAVSTQPLFVASERAWLHERLGPERARHTYPLRDLLDAGVLVGGASDAPIESTDVMRAIECCVTRDGFEVHQAIRADEALRLFTLDAAKIQHQEDEKGSLRPSKRADLVHLDANPLSVPAERISEIHVLRTVVGGKTVYVRGETR